MKRLSILGLSLASALGCHEGPVRIVPPVTAGPPYSGFLRINPNLNKPYTFLVESSEPTKTSSGVKMTPLLAAKVSITFESKMSKTVALMKPNISSQFRARVRIFDVTGRVLSEDSFAKQGASFQCTVYDTGGMNPDRESIDNKQAEMLLMGIASRCLVTLPQSTVKTGLNEGEVPEYGKGSENMVHFTGNWHVDSIRGNDVAIEFTTKSNQNRNGAHYAWIGHEKEDIDARDGMPIAIYGSGERLAPTKSPSGQSWVTRLSS